MRYIADANGYLKQVSLGAAFTCNETECREYTGPVPSGYSTLESWFAWESENLYCWRVVNNALTKDSSAAEPSVQEWADPPMELDTEYRTTERYLGKPVYAKVVDFGALPNASSKNTVFSKVSATAISITVLLSDGCVLSAGYGKDRGHNLTQGMNIDCTHYNIRIATEADFTSLTANVLVKYVLD